MGKEIIKKHEGCNFTEADISKMIREFLSENSHGIAHFMLDNHCYKVYGQTGPIKITLSCSSENI